MKVIMFTKEDSINNKHLLGELLIAYYKEFDYYQRCYYFVHRDDLKTGIKVFNEDNVDIAEISDTIRFEECDVIEMGDL